MLTDLGQVVELTGRQVVSHHVAAVVGEPELAGSRVELETDRITHAAGEGLLCAAVGIHSDDRPEAFPITDVARCADAHVQAAVRAEAYVAPAMMTFSREVVAEDLELRARREIVLDVRETQQPAGLGHVEIAIENVNAVGRG